MQNWFGRAPAMYMATLLAAVQMLSVLAHLDGTTQNLLTVGVTALFALITAATTRPLDISMITGALTTLVTVVGWLAFHLSADALSGFNTALVAVVTAILTLLVSPSKAMGGPLHLRLRQPEEPSTGTRYRSRH